MHDPLTPCPLPPLVLVVGGGGAGALGLRVLSIVVAGGGNVSGGGGGRLNHLLGLRVRGPEGGGRLVVGGLLLLQQSTLVVVLLLGEGRVGGGRVAKVLLSEAGVLAVEGGLGLIGLGLEGGGQMGLISGGLVGGGHLGLVRGGLVVSSGQVGLLLVVGGRSGGGVGGLLVGSGGGVRGLLVGSGGGVGGLLVGGGGGVRGLLVSRGREGGHSRGGHYGGLYCWRRHYTALVLALRGRGGGGGGIVVGVQAIAGDHCEHREADQLQIEQNCVLDSLEISMSDFHSTSPLIGEG